MNEGRGEHFVSLPPPGGQADFFFLLLFVLTHLVFVNG